MKIENDHAIIENLAELECLFPEPCLKVNKGWKFCEIHELLITYTASRQEVKEKLQVKAGENYFCFTNHNLFYYPTTLPDYLKDKDNIKNNDSEDIGIDTILIYYYLPINILTINKSIQALYDLGKWCGLWE